MSRNFWSQQFLYIAGIAFLALAKFKHMMRGYSTPKPFPLNEADRCIDYSVSVGRDYISRMRKAGVDIVGKHVLELGPGSDLGLGLFLVKEGAASYVGFDKNDLAKNVPRTFYKHMADRQLVDLSALDDGRVSYVVDPDFNVSNLDRQFDIVVSNAAFEHFDDVRGVIGQLFKVVRPGGLASVSVDLQTHSRWIREKDPNNIYRYPRWLFRLFYFPGQPNRVRPSEYKTFFEISGWRSIELSPQNLLDESLGVKLHKLFEEDRFTSWLSFTLNARR